MDVAGLVLKVLAAIILVVILYVMYKGYRLTHPVKKSPLKMFDPNVDRR